MVWRKTPELCPASSCSSELDFKPVNHWPSGLPAVAVEGYLLAGFQQDFAFNHQGDLHNTLDITELFCSLYNDLSFMELTRLGSISRHLEWFPFESIAQNYRLGISSQFFELAPILLSSPEEFQIWAAQKKMHQGDFQPLLARHHMPEIQQRDLQKVLAAIAAISPSKSQACQILEWSVDLLLKDQTWSEIQFEKSTEFWLEKLKKLRFPHTQEIDQVVSRRALHLPWPGSSQVRWTRQGDQSGIEVKLFVSDPKDIQNCVHSFQKILKELEKKDANPWIPH